MRLLFDQNLSFRILKYLGSDFPGSSQVKKEGLLNAEDIEIWEFALKNDFTIVSRDQDFIDISMRKGSPPKIILLRIGNKSTEEISALLLRKKDSIIEFLNSPEMKEIACLELEEGI